VNAATANARDGPPAGLPAYRRSGGLPKLPFDRKYMRRAVRGLQQEENELR